MKLYVYEHCPYCVKARMIFGFKELKFDLHFLLNDEEKFLLDTVGQKMVPMLIKDDGSAMLESMDIVNYVDQLQGQPIVKKSSTPAIVQWANKIYPSYNNLCLPHFTLFDFPEFQTHSAIEYFTAKKEKYLGNSFEFLRENRDNYIEEINQSLIILDKLLATTYVSSEISIDDFQIFPILRNLSLIKGTKFPDNLLNYAQKIANKSHINLFFDRKL